MERKNLVDIEKLNHDFEAALAAWKHDDTHETAIKINELIERGGGDYADFVLKIPRRVIEKPNGKGRAISQELAEMYGKKEGKEWIFDIHGNSRLGIKVLVNNETHFLVLKHKGEGPIGFFIGKEISSIAAI